MAKKKLLIYAHYYMPDTASTGQILRELAEGMLDKFDITIICVVPSYLGTIEVKYKTQKYYEEEINGVKIMRIRVPEFSKTNKKSCVKNIDELEMLHRRCPMGVFSHDEAFYYYGLTDREPLVHTLTIYSGYNAHRLKEDGYKVYTVKKELLDVGKRTVKSNQGNEIPMYDLERTICDLVRSRSSIEVQDFNAVLKAYVGRKDKDLNKLMKYAKLFRVDKIVRNYMEVLL